MGNSREVTAQHPLGDILNEPGEALRLSSARLDGAGSDCPEILGEVTLEKRAILLAVPLESEEYQVERRVHRLGLPLPTQRRVSVLVLVGSFVVKGYTHVSPTGSPAEQYDPAASLRAGIGNSSLRRFFPLTGASVSGLGELPETFAVVLVNRERVEGIIPLSAATD